MKSYPALLLVVLALGWSGCAKPLETATATPELATTTTAPITPDQATVTSTVRTLTPAATLTESPTATEPTATESPTLPSPTFLIVPDPTVGTPYPTPTARATSFIIIVTPLPTEHYCDFTEAYFTPYARMRVRNAANLNATIVGYLEIGQRQPVCDEVNVGDQTWLCLDIVHDLAGNPVGSDCGRVVAYRIGSTEYGELVVIWP